MTPSSIGASIVAMPPGAAKRKNAVRRASVARPQIDRVRHFNRFYTRQLGLLDEGYLSSNRTLTEARVLYELAHTREVTAARIAQELRLDVAYLSRMLSGFEQQRLLKRTRSRTDARQRHLALTAKGLAAFEPLERSAEKQVSAMLAPLAESERVRLVSAMRCVQSLLERAPAAASCTLRALQVGDIGWITHRQGLLYAEEYGWDVSYEALVAEILAAFVRDFDPRTSASWIAESVGSVIGSVFLMPAAGGLGKLRLLYVEPSARGMGLGRRLVEECILGARARGYRRLTLWTNSVLTSARRIYEAVGFELRSEEPHRSFGKDLTGQTWELTL